MLKNKSLTKQLNCQHLAGSNSYNTRTLLKHKIKKQNLKIGYVGKQRELLKNFEGAENFFDNVVNQSRSRISFKI